MNTPRTPQKPLFEDQKQVRVTVPVDPDVLKAFQRLASVSGMSTGKAMGEWLSDTLAGVEMMTGLLERAKEAPKIAARELHAYATGLTCLTSDLIDEIKVKSARSALREEGTAPAGGTSRNAERAASVRSILRDSKKRGESALPPPVSNTGGKVPKKPGKGG